MSKHILIATQNDGSVGSIVAKEALVNKFLVEFEENGINCVDSSKAVSNQPNFDHFFSDGSCVSVRQVSALFPHLTKQQYDEIYLTPMLSNHELTKNLKSMLKTDKRDCAFVYSLHRDKGLDVNKL